MIVDLNQAVKFVNEHPAEQIPGYNPNFPGTIGDDLAETKSYLKNVMNMDQLIADEMATALILDKYHTGTALLKQDANGNFNRFGTTATVSSDGSSKTYGANNCK